MKLDRSSEAYFAALRSSSVQNAAVVSSSDPRIVELLGGMPAAAGVYVTAESAMRVAAVYACVNRIASGVSTLPLNIFERTWDAGRATFTERQVEDAPLWWLLNEQPTDAWPAQAHWSCTIEHRLLRGDHFTEICRSPSGAIRELVPMPWSAVVADTLTQEVGSRLFYSVNDGLRVRGVDQDDMLHFAGFGFDGVRGYSVISHAGRNSIGNSIAMDEYSGKYFAGGAHPSMVLEADGKLSDAALQQLKKEFAENYGGLRNAHAKPLVLSNGVKAKAISISPDDSQLLDSKKFGVLEIARLFGVPPHLIGETSGSTSWGTGIESMGRGFVMYTLAAHCKAIEDEINRKLFRTIKRFVRFDWSGLLQGDLAAQAAFYRSALGGPGTGPGFMSVNEVRHERGLPPLPGQDSPFVPQPTPPKGAGGAEPPEAKP